MTYYIAQVSNGKDSLAMTLELIRRKYPLDEVVFYDTGMEFEAIYRNWNKLCALLDQYGIKHTKLEPQIPFLYKMIDRKYTQRNGNIKKGYDWCGGTCRWGTTDKTAITDSYLRNIKADSIVEYIGIAADEKHRIKDKVYPLVDWDMTEADCLRKCRGQGWDWLEETPVTESGYIDLYDILDRVSCWCCANKNLKELRNIRKYLPQYWDKLLDLQRQIDRPMKSYSRKGVPCGSVFDLDARFAIEDQEVTERSE